MSKESNLRQIRLVALILVVASGISLATPSQAQTNYSFSAGLLGGIGGSLDGEPDTGIDNLGLQAIFSMQTDIHTRFGVRLGRQDLEADDSGLFDRELTYLTLAGEYRFSANYYDSGIFLGLGGYDLESDFFEGESSLGLTAGATGDFRLTSRLSLLVEISGHYVDLDYAQFFVMGHVGLVVHF